MKHKRVASILVALLLILVANQSQDKGYDATKMKAINSDLVWLSISSFKNQRDGLDITCQTCK
jgi:hypothetical protein